MTGTAPPGLDLERLGEWFSRSVPQAGRDLTARILPGGRSNLTYEVSDGQRSWVLRRPPLGHVLATAHDMSREYRVISALAPTSVPVPAAYALCTDAGVIGAPFYVMERVDGTAYRFASELEPLGPERTRAISRALVDTLTALHEVDPAAVGLGELGKPEGFLARQVSRWDKQLGASRSRDLPDAASLHDHLAAAVPAQSPAGIVHGDYRLDNVLTDAAGQPRAVIDWEMATIGDPLTDLALLIVYQRLGRLAGGIIADASSAPGFLREDEILARYAARSQRAASALGFYLGLAAFKLAAVTEGIHYRHCRGQTVGAGFERIGELTEPLLAAGLAFLKER
jgi:aminoglycoside phosphotransferase (APT) family kinase protein